MRPLASLLSILLGALASVSLAPLLAPASAQSQAGAGSQPDLVAVILWTLAIIAIGMLILTLGYLYRRTRGEVDEVIPQNVEPYFEAVGQAEAHSTGEFHPELPPVRDEHGATPGQAPSSAH
ncbi:MAG TPA: hypothetical protein VK821_03960 [Dehalococcoidia bacterium]|nr:hypothetical protein [Dehalococcoidia bacterium]